MNEPTKITLYADNTPYQVLDLKDIDEMSEEEYNDKLKDAWFKKTPYQVLDLKDIDEMSEEEYNDKLKDAWFKKTHYETVEELTMAKYYSYEVEEQKKPEETENNESLGLLCRILPFVFKTMFSKEPITFVDKTQTFSVIKGDLYLDFDENVDIEKRTALEAELKKKESKYKKEPNEALKAQIDDLKEDIAALHNYSYVGRVSSFVPMQLGVILSTVLSISIFGGLIICLFWILGKLVGG